MSRDIVISEKKKAFLAYKETILEEIKYYDSRIQDVRSKIKCGLFENDDSSDSETDVPLQLSEAGPSLRELKDQELLLKTCLHATQELTRLEVLQSEVNVMVEDPVLEKGSIKEDGVWREVIADCCVDLVPFSIIFYAHKPSRKFSPTTYHSLRVVPVKQPHEAELARSVLAGLTRPSDAVEVLRSYALAHRSRRSTLARLTDKYASSLFMEPMPEGGYLLKCANLLQIQWTLVNKWSPIAPFHHSMKFDLEYMDESYIKIITQTHRQLSSPDVDTDERTLLLSKIISTCLEAQGPTQDLYDSLSDDPEAARKLATRRTTLDKEPEMPVIKRKKDSEVMAPPKSLPKKSRPKSDGNKKGEAVKRGSDDNNAGNTKKMRVDDNEDVNDTTKAMAPPKSLPKKSRPKSDANKKGDDMQKGDDNVGSTKNNEEVSNTSKAPKSLPKKTGPKGDENKGEAVKSVGNTKKIKVNNVEVNDVSKKSVGNKDDAQESIVAGNTVAKSNIADVASFIPTATKAKVVKKVVKPTDNKVDKNIVKTNKMVTKKTDKKGENIEKSEENNATTKSASKTIEKTKNVGGKDKLTTELNKETKSNVASSKMNSAGRNDGTENVAEGSKKVASTKNNNTEAKTGNNVEKRKVDRNTMTNKVPDGKVVKKMVAKTTEKVIKKVASAKNQQSVKKNENNVANVKNIDVDKVSSTSATDNLKKNVASAKPIETTNKAKKTVKNQDDVFVNNNQMKKAPLKVVNKPKIGNTGTKIPLANSSSASNTEKENKGGNRQTLLSKLAPKSKLPISESIFKKIPLRVSPRKPAPKITTSPMRVNLKSKVIQKPITSIPRLMTKAKPKIK